MQFYPSPLSEARAIRRAVARVAGCRVLKLDVRAGGITGDLDCTDGWRAAWLLLALAEEDARTPGARALAAELRSKAPSDLAYARLVHEYVRRRVRFEREEGEIFQSAGFTLKSAYGDCDDHFRVVYALAVAGGLPARLGILHHGFDAPPDKRGPAHAAALLCPSDGPSACQWAETTIAARYGEQPNAAARRLGVATDRTDIAKEVVIMSSKDLPPIPAGFEERNPAEQVELDAAALQRLGYLDCSATLPTDATEPMFRAAVLAFQVAAGVSQDGMIGPETRGALARLDSSYTMGDMGAPASPPLFTHAQARESLRKAYVAQFGHEPSQGELDFGLATAYFETFYGRGGAAGWANRGQFGRWAAEGKLNWGALESGSPNGDARLIARFTAAGLHPTLEKGSDGGNVRYFYLFPSDDEAAAAFLMVWGAADILAAAQTGSASAVSAAMRKHGYYEGFHVGPGKLTPQLMAANARGGHFVEEASDDIALQKNIAEYAAALARTVKTVGGPGGVDDPTSNGVVSAPLVAIGATIALVGWAFAYAKGWL